MTIISASRRTDIPAFYADWFMNRIRAGTVVYTNPVSHAPCRISLAPQDVHSIVFWTRNVEPMLGYLPELARRGYGWTAHYTITGAPPCFEPRVPPLRLAIESFRRLAALSSPRHLFWRFDPILLSSETPPAYWLDRFAFIAERLEGATVTCITSFV